MNAAGVSRFWQIASTRLRAAVTDMPLQDIVAMSKRSRRFNANSSRAVDQLSDRLNAIARLAVGDTEALQRIGVTAVMKLLKKPAG
jgi:hypothetical protein